MKYQQAHLFPVLLISGLLLLGACARRGTTSTTAVVSAPAESKTSLAGDLALAQDRLNRAASELENKNEYSALEYIGIAHDEMEMAAREAGEDDAQIESAISDLDAVKAMIEKHEGQAQNSLTKVIEKVSQLNGNRGGENSD